MKISSVRQMALVSLLPLLGGLLYLWGSFLLDVRTYDRPSQKADAIVVLTGGLNRVEEGLKALRSGVSELLILSGVNEVSEIDAIFLNLGITEEERSRIILEKKSTSTYENAIEVSRIAEDLKLSSIVLVTSAYHMKRALATFKKVFPENAKIEPMSVSTPNFDEKKWWEGKTLSILTLEFFKYYWYKTRFALGSLTR